MDNSSNTVNKSTNYSDSAYILQRRETDLDYCIRVLNDEDFKNTTMDLDEPFDLNLNEEHSNILNNNLNNNLRSNEENSNNLNNNLNSNE